jgi:hypothetical protein
MIAGPYRATTADNERALRDYLLTAVPAQAQHILGSAPLILRPESMGLALSICDTLDDEIVRRRARHRLAVLDRAQHFGVTEAFTRLILDPSDGHDRHPEGAVDLGAIFTELGSTPVTAYEDWFHAHPELVCHEVIDAIPTLAQGLEPSHAAARVAVAVAVQTFLFRRVFAVGAHQAVAEYLAADAQLPVEFADSPDVEVAQTILDLAAAAGDLFDPHRSYPDRIRCLQEHPELLDDDNRDLVARLIPPYQEDGHPRTPEHEANSLFATAVEFGLEEGCLQAFLQEIIWATDRERARTLAHEYVGLLVPYGTDPCPQVELEDDGLRARVEDRLALLRSAYQSRHGHAHEAVERVIACGSWPELRYLLHQGEILRTEYVQDLVADMPHTGTRLGFDLADLFERLPQDGIDRAVEQCRRAALGQRLQDETARSVINFDREHLEQLGMHQAAADLGREYSTMVRGLIQVLMDEYDRVPDEQHLTDALTISDSDLDWLSPATADRGRALCLRASILSRRYEHLGAVADAEEIIAVTAEALSCPVEPFYQAEAQSQRVQALLGRFQVSGDRRYLGEASEALADGMRLLAHADLPADATVLMGLHTARLHHQMYHASHDRQHLVEAATALETLLERDDLNDERTAAVRIGLSLVYESDGDDEQALEQAMISWHRSTPGQLSHAHATTAVGRLLAAMPDTANNRQRLIQWRPTMQAVLIGMRIPARWALDLHASIMAGHAIEHDWHHAAAAGARLLEAYRQMHAGQIMSAHRETIIRDVGHLPAEVAIYQARAGQLWTAMATLDGNRMAALQDQTGVPLPTDDDDPLVQRAIADIHQYERLIASTGRGSPTSRQSSRNTAGLVVLREAHQRYETARRFLLGRLPDPVVAEAAQHRLVEAARQVGTIVYATAGIHGGVALIARSDRAPEVIELPLLRHRTVKGMVTALYGRGGARPETLDEACRALWDMYVAPLTACLGSEPHLLMPSGHLGLLPLAAAWRPDDATPTGRLYAIDVMAWSQGLLALGRNIAQPTRTDTGAQVLIVDNPTTALDPLLWSHVEASAVRAAHPAAVVMSGPDATVDNVARGLAEAAFAHLSCHGQADLLNPRESHVRLADGVLTIADLAGARLRRDCVIVLSSCESARVDAALPDEAIGLPGTLVLAGAARVVGSLWQVPQTATAEIMLRLYGHLVAGLDLPSALRQAQIDTRDSTTRDKRHLFDAHQVAYPGLAPRDSRPHARIPDWAGFQVYERVAR